jgi:ribosomal protein S18 acetylase RimI-like enzyme
VSAAPALSLAIGLLTPTEIPAARELLAHAFESNPLNRAAVRKRSAAARRRCNTHGMRLHLPVALAHGQVLGARLPDGLAGVLISAPPLTYPFPPGPFGARLRCLIAQGPRVALRWGAVFARTDAAHPREPHWYLGTLGVDPRCQRRGVGRQLLARWLDEVDAEGLPAYLETDREENLDFYRAAGFAVAGEDRILGVPVWFMIRPGRDGAKLSLDARLG